MIKSMSKNVVRMLAVGLLGGSVLTACGSAPKVPDDSFYRLNVSSLDVGAQTLKGVIEVDRFAASGSLGNRPLLMSKSDSNAVTEYHYHFWIESPPELLQSALISYLRSSKVAGRIVTPEMRVVPDYTIAGRVIRMETVRGSNPKGLVTFELSLRREKDGKLLVLKEYNQEIPASQDRVGAGAVAIEKAVNQVFGAFIADIRKFGA